MNRCIYKRLKFIYIGFRTSIFKLSSTTVEHIGCFPLTLYIILLINLQGEVCLLKGHNVFVPGNKLRQLINESKVKGPTHLLQKLIPLVFTVEELANSCGQGITSSTNSKTQVCGGDLAKKPLDQTKTRVLKGRSSYCIL